MDSQNENHVFQFYIRQAVGGDFYLELGDETLFETDLMSSEDLLQWAEENELLDLSIEELRIIKKRQDEENGNIISSPASRAHDFFQDDLQVELPKELGIEFIEGFVPGNDCQLVILRDMTKIDQLKYFLYDQKLNVSFTLIEKDV
jgi:hypothetical protein